MHTKLLNLGIAVLFSVVALCVSGTAYSQEELNDNREIKRHKEHTEGMTEPVYKRLGRVHTLIGENDLTKALEDLAKLQKIRLNDHEKALVQQNLGFIYVQQDRNQEALAAFEKSLSYNQLPGPVVQGLRYSLASLYAAEAQFLESIKTMRIWFQYEAEPKAEAWMVIASGFAELERFDDALPYVQKAIEKSEKPMEDWYLLELAIHVERNDFRAGAHLLKVMLQFWPEKPQYWELLTSVYIEIKEDRKALDAMMVSYRNGFIKNEPKLLALAQLNLLLKIPHTAASILEAELASGRIKEKKSTLDMLLQAWTDARSYDKAVNVSDRLAELTGDGKYLMRTASIHNEQGQWRAAAEAAKRAIEMGVDDPAKAYMLAGTVLVELGRFRESLAAFQNVKNTGTAKEGGNADEWIAFVSEKIELRAALAN